MNTEDELWLNILVISANIIGFLYNLPQVYLTIKTKKTDDISSLFLFMRLLSSILWIIYSSYKQDWQVLISWLITSTSNIVILYYKFIYNKFCKFDSNLSNELPK